MATNLVSLEALCVKVGEEVHRLVVTLTGLPSVSVDLGLLAFLTAALHRGVPIRFMPNILHFQKVADELCLDCLADEDADSSFLLILDDTFNILYAQ